MEPGSFLNLMINSKHSNGEPFSDLLASSQAFTFLLVRPFVLVDAHQSPLLLTSDHVACKPLALSRPPFCLVGIQCVCQLQAGLGCL